MKKNIKTNKAPNPIGPYSQAIYINNFLYISGQIPLDPKTEKIVYGGIENEIHQIMKNISNILEEVNMNFSNIIKLTIFTKNIDFINIINKIYQKYFINNVVYYPAREVVEVSNLPMNANLEISLIAFKD